MTEPVTKIILTTKQPDCDAKFKELVNKMTEADRVVFGDFLMHWIDGDAEGAVSLMRKLVPKAAADAPIFKDVERTALRNRQNNKGEGKAGET